MASERKDSGIPDECADSLSNVPIDFVDCVKIEDITSSENQSEEESSDDYEIPTQRKRRMLLYPSDMEELDDDCSVEWSDLDLSKNSNEFKGSLDPNVFPKNIQNVENVIELFIGNDLFEFICTETNRYYKQNSNRRKPDKKSVKFVDVTVTELKKWFGLAIIMGIIRKRKMEDYWSTNPLLETPIFHRTMSRNRFRQILSFLHFSNDNNKPDNADRLYKVQTIIDYFTKKFKEDFNFGQNIIKRMQRISTVHNDDLVDAEKECRKTNRAIKKFKSEEDYNKYMKDQFLSYYPIRRKTKNWSKKMVFYLFNCALYNAYKLYQHYNNAECKSLCFQDFLLEICESWIKDHLPATEEKLEVSTISRATNHGSINRLSGQLEQHQLILICETNKRKRRRCHVCYKNKKVNKATNLMCKSCGVALHLGDCFASYHLKEKY